MYMRYKYDYRSIPFENLILNLQVSKQSNKITIVHNNLTTTNTNPDIIFSFEINYLIQVSIIHLCIAAEKLF